ncbi:ATP-binding protein [Massilia sp. W12]|uniref:sensor histidine kinase n=1 Tax=Massilia sp. W12 TaxID=3126507 RepID=UPI0030D0EE74
MKPSHNNPKRNNANDPWLRATHDAVVYIRERDFVELDLIQAGMGKVRGRLYQINSLANGDDAPLMEQLPQYAVGKKLRVYAFKQGVNAGRVFYHVHERWADANSPWQELNLYEDDIVTGIVKNAVVKNGELKGWVVKLDAGQTFPTDRDAGEQPDIDVFLPLDQIPWADGGVEKPASPATKRLKLERGDRLMLRITAIKEPPMNPYASIISLIHHFDADEVSAVQLQEHHLEQAAEEKEEVTTMPAALLAERVIWLVDDNDGQMQHLAQRLEANGAKTKTFLVEAGQWELRCTQMVEKLAESVLLAPLSRNRAPDLVLVDLHLLQQEKGGAQLIARWHTLASNAGKNMPPCCLLSSLIPAGQVWQHCCGTLMRPLQLGSLLALLNGQPVWQGSLTAGIQLNAGDNQKPGPWLEQLRQDCHADFTVLLAAYGQQDLRFIGSAGKPPFTAQMLNEVMEHSELRLLLGNKLKQLQLEPKDHKPSLKAKAESHALWVAITSGDEVSQSVEWIIGIGTAEAISKKETAWIMRYAKQALLNMRQADAMQNLGDLLSKGARFDALGHEWMHRQHIFSTVLEDLEKWRTQLQTEQKPLNEFLPWLNKYLPHWKTATTDLQQTADLILGIQRGRHTPLDLQRVMAMLYPLARKSCDSREVALLWPQHIPPLFLDLPASAVSIPLLNLIDNAAKHHIRKENNWVRLQLDIPLDGAYAGHLVCSISDNSFGLSSGQQSKLFQLMHSNAQHEENHGIGLWLARQVVKGHGADIKLAYSWRGIGTKFELVLPMPLEKKDINQ